MGADVSADPQGGRSLICGARRSALPGPADPQGGRLWTPRLICVDLQMDGWMREWMDGWMRGWMDGWMRGWMDGWIVDGWMDGWRHAWTHGSMDGWMRGRMDARMDGRSDTWTDEAPAGFR